MKIFRFIAFFLCFLFLVTCGSEDDICLGGDATPRMKLKFKTLATGKLKTLDSVFVKIDYGQGPVEVVSLKRKTDSLLLPMRVDDAPFTRIYIGLSSRKAFSEVDIHYTTDAQYVSPACGIKKIYRGVSSDLNVRNDVKALEQNQNEISDENKTHLYLLF